MDRTLHRKKVGGVLDAVKDKLHGAAAILKLEDYKDTWTLIHGSKPVLDDNYLYFQQIDDALNQHPNFLHFQITQFLEELNYIIVNEVKPLPDEIKLNEKEQIIYHYKGYIGASIDTKREKIKGYTKIFCKEEGICYFSSEFDPPYVKGNIRIAFGGIVNNMKHEELQQDILNLKGKIEGALRTDIPF